MMTIKVFAELCGCTTQTLRYYDRVGLLTPARVDEWTGYRYYEERQALDFVKIRNLQAADFTIGEIRELLTQPDEAVYEAFEGKIARQEEKLRRIREIRQTYLREMNAMEKMLNGMINYLLDGCRTPAVLREFGCDESDFDRVMAALRTWLETTFDAQDVAADQVALEVNGERTEGVDGVTERIAALRRDVWQDEVRFADGSADEAAYAVVWEKHGWAHPAEFLREIPPLTDGEKVQFAVALAEFPWPKDLSYSMFMIGVMLLERGPFPCRGCEVTRSEDGVNHFALLRRV